MLGVIIRDALSKARKLRKLAPKTCTVYKLSDPDKVRNEFLVCQNG